jgi:hypothetical protein
MISEQIRRIQMNVRLRQSFWHNGSEWSAARVTTVL